MAVRQRRLAMLATAIAALVGFVALAGCAADQASDSEAPARADSDSGDVGAMPPEPGGEAGGVQIPVRHIIYTGAITVAVTDVDAAAEAATRLTERYQGFIGVDRRTSDDRDAQAYLVLRIPSERFTDAVAALGELGEEHHRDIETDDVTANVVDVATRVTVAQTSLERTRQLLERAETIAEIMTIEAELAKREAELASLQARQRTLDELTTLSTIEVTLLGPEAAQEALRPGFLTGLAAGWQGFTLTMAVLMTVLGFLVPWLVVLAVPGSVLAWWLWRRRAARRTAQQPAR